MSKICDHTSVGMIVWKDDKILLIERMKYPFGFACPAGHVDGDASYEESAKRELQEEVGLEVINLELLFEGRKENPCRRENGSWHYWKIYKVKAEGEAKRSLDETKKMFWASKDELKKISERTEKYLQKEISEEDWEKSPGLEPIWCEWFKQLNLI